MPLPHELLAAIDKADNSGVSREMRLHLGMMRKTLQRHQIVWSSMGNSVCSTCCIPIEQLPIRMPRVPVAWPCSDVQDVLSMLDLMEAW